MSWSPQGRSVGHNRASKPTHVSRLSPSPGEGRAGVRGSTASSHLSPMFSRREEEGTVGLPGGQRCAQVRDEAQGGVQAFRAMPGFPELLASLHLGPTPSRVFRMKGACSQSHGPLPSLFLPRLSSLSSLPPAPASLTSNICSNNKPGSSLLTGTWVVWFRVPWLLRIMCQMV